MEFGLYNSSILNLHGFHVYPWSPARIRYQSDQYAGVGEILRWVLSTLVQFIIGWRFYTGSYKALRHGYANMDVLIALGTNAAYFYSFYSMLRAATSEDFKSTNFFETSFMLISFSLLGKYLEVLAKVWNVKKSVHLVQGTLHPDVIKPCPLPGSGRTHSHAIKSHHNVGGLPKDMKLKLIEPLKLLFLDEVRELWRILNVPQAFLQRHPFPRPGLVERVLGDVTEKIPWIFNARLMRFSSNQPKMLENGSFWALRWEPYKRFRHG